MKKNALVIPVLMILGATQIQAQPWRMGGQGPLQRIEELKKVRLIEMLNLNEDQSTRFFARLNEHDSTKRDLMKQRSEVLDKIERLVRNHADSKDFEQLFPAVDAIDAKIIEERHRFFDGLGDILSAEQRGKYLLFYRYFEKELRDAMREVQRRRRGMDEP